MQKLRQKKVIMIVNKEDELENETEEINDSEEDAEFILEDSDSDSEQENKV